MWSLSKIHIIIDVELKKYTSIILNPFIYIYIYIYIPKQLKDVILHNEGKFLVF